ncbi:hypothetical protein BVRB_2g037030 isoform A [Beta vulgaris subsp. vulgaris]|nr:hypothetical protein BVRB_2g037030 isoform A [Beta vulgaris subsp. vulgaris]
MEVMHHSTAFLLPLIPSEQGFSLKYALVILNQRLPRFTPLLWEHAKLRICADGGANRLFDELPQFFPQQNPLDVRNRYKPDLIKGDMDSIRSEVLDFYAKLGCDAINESHDQDTTDLHKCISHLSNLTPESEKANLCILVTGALGGRFDHEAGNINVLYRFPGLRIILLSDDCLIQLLPRAHRHEILIQSSVVGPHCGVLPIGSPAFHTTTSGLEWNLTDAEMVFGGLISTSNLVTGDIVCVHSDTDLIWTICIKSST